MDSIPQTVMGLAIVWLVVSGIALIVIAYCMRTMLKMLREWHGDWAAVAVADLDRRYPDEAPEAAPAPPPPPPPRQEDSADRARARLIREDRPRPARGAATRRQSSRLDQWRQ